MISLIAAAAAGILIAAIGAYVARNVLTPGASNTVAATTHDGN